MAEHNETGRKGEDLAAELLTAKGYHILDRNYRFQQAEIDLVALMLDPGELVFVEVKTRKSQKWGYPEVAVDAAKKRQMFKAADAYLHEKQMRTVPVRFDVIAVTLLPEEDPLFLHVEDAFRMLDPL